MTSRRLVMHRRACRKVRVRTRRQDPPVCAQGPFDDDDGVGRGMAMVLSPQTCCVANQIMLGSRSGILVEEPKTDGPVLDHRLRFGQVQTGQSLREDSLTRILDLVAARHT
jgi:hypothetical protein